MLLVSTMDQKEVDTEEILAQISADILTVYDQQFGQNLQPIFDEKSDHAVGPCLEVEFPPQGKKSVQLATLKQVASNYPTVTQIIQTKEDSTWILRLDM